MLLGQVLAGGKGAELKGNCEGTVQRYLINQPLICIQRKSSGFMSSMNKSKYVLCIEKGGKNPIL